jgi:hypothetical protein
MEPLREMNDLVHLAFSLLPSLPRPPHTGLVARNLVDFNHVPLPLFRVLSS